MAQSIFNLHRHQKRVKVNKKRNKLEYLMYPIAMVGPIMTVPQVYEIWINKQIQGVSIISWGAFMILAAFWAGYGIIHKEKPIILNAIATFFLDVLIVSGLILIH